MHKNLTLSLVALLVTGWHANATDKPAVPPSKQLSARPSVAMASRLFQQLNSYAQQGNAAIKPAGVHSPLKAAAASALIPGAGQAYNKSWIKSAFFFAIELGGWLAYRQYDQEGDNLSNEYEAFADLHWNEEKYWAWLAEGSGCSASDRSCLQEYERSTFSHHLPEGENQSYYENIGKYDQFNIGWDDAQEGGGRDSANREAYDLMRADANDKYRTATLFASAVLLNHVFSAFDAAWTTNRYNKRIARASFGFLRSSDRQLHPALTLKLAW